MSIKIRNVSKQFGNFHALRDLNLDIASGELIALLGPSGCGKTTLLRIIAGLETPDAGSIHFSDQDQTGVHVRERGVGFVFQHYALFKHMSVFDNVAFGLRMKPRKERPSEAQIRAKVMELLTLVQLDWVAERFPAQLSGGQRQRIALARALAVEPQVLLLDEPFGALDAKVRKELRRWLRRLHDELHVTSIFVTHDQEEAMEVADRVVIINQGQIEQQGTPQEVWDNPASPFVYRFLGDVNLFHARGLVPTPASAAHAAPVAYVRPHELDVAPYVADASAAAATASDTGAVAAGGVEAASVVAQLERAIVVGPIARLELTARGMGQTASAGAAQSWIEAHIPVQQFHSMGLEAGQLLRLTPRRAHFFNTQGVSV